MPASIFSETELARLASFPEEIPGDDLIRAFTLTGADRDLVALRRGAANRLGLALQLCALRYLGFVPRNLSAAPRSAACFVADQLFEALASSRPSSWARLSALSKGSTRVVYVLFCARPRAELTSRTIRAGSASSSAVVRIARFMLLPEGVPNSVAGFDGAMCGRGCRGAAFIIRHNPIADST